MKKLLCFILLFIASGYCYATDAFVERKTATYKDSVTFDAGFGVTEDAAWHIGAGSGSAATTSNSLLNAWNGIYLPDPDFNLLVAGNVGIGTTSPNEKLEVNGNIRLAGTNLIFFPGSASANLISDPWDTGSVEIRSGTNSPLGVLVKKGTGVIVTGGNVGIGTTGPGYPLEVNGNIGFTAVAKGLVLKQGANGKCGTFVCNGVTPVTVSNTSIAITDVVIPSLNTVGGTVGALPVLQTITAGVGFTVAGTALDSSTYNYCIISSAP